jgi:choline dehydrogenase-like flavoprotein
VTVDAPVVVIAGGAVESPALLMRSGMGGGAVGRFLRLHPTTAVMGDYGEETYALAGIPQSALCDEFMASPGREYGFWIEVPALGPSLAAAAASGFGAEHREHMRGLRSTVPLIALIRDGADLGVSNGNVRVDRRGAPRVSYRLGATDTTTLADAVSATAQLHFAAGARRVRTLHTRPVVMDGPQDLERLHGARYGPNEIALFSAHVNGTCRMGTDPRSSVTSPEGERWGSRGVYVCDGSLLPTAIGVNPQETIMALAMLVAESAAAR